MSETLNKVKLGQLEFGLQAPASYAARHEIMSAVVVNARRAQAAALGACIPGVNKRLKIQPYEADYNVLAYGGRVIDGLIAQGLDMSEIIVQAVVAFAFLVDQTLPSEQEVKAAEDFTAARPAESTS